MIRLLTFILLFLFMYSCVNADEGRHEKKASSKEQIKRLKDGVLLVRIHTMESSIRALNEINKFKLANKIKIRQETRNKNIISAFRNNFTFCPVYFFSSIYSDSILSNHLNGIIFLNDNLQPDSSIRIGNQKYLTAEFAFIDQDTSKYLSDYYYHAGQKGLERRSAYYGETDMRFEVLKIMSDRLVYLNLSVYLWYGC